MNETIEIHDSTLAAAVRDGADLVLSFAPAVVHRSEGAAGVAPGSVWLQDLDLIVSDARVEAIPARLPSWLVDGEFVAGDRSFPNGIPIEPPASGAVALAATTEHGERLAVFGSEAAITRRGSPARLEDFPGHASNRDPDPIRPPVVDRRS